MLHRITDGLKSGAAPEPIVILDTSQGWSVDNFEGLARHRGMKFFLVSDDNFKGIQRTLLVYLELLDEWGPAATDGMPEHELGQTSTN